MAGPTGLEPPIFDAFRARNARSSTGRFSAQRLMEATPRLEVMRLEDLRFVRTIGNAGAGVICPLAVVAALHGFV
jgi:hypothetical protein